MQALHVLKSTGGGSKLLSNGTEEWFTKYAERQMFTKLGYTSPLSELMADEAEWFAAISAAFGQARSALGRLHGKKNV